jgi:plastocyanin
MRTVAAVAMALAAGCGGSGARPATHPVEIRAFAFHPDTVAAAPGDTMVWTNRDVVPHTATAPGRAWDTGMIAAGAIGRTVAGARGTYAYVCAYHPTMRAVLVVR